MNRTPPEVVYGDPEPNGLAAMLGGLIEANLARDPARAELLRTATVAIVAPDAGVAATIHLTPGRVDLANGSPSAAVHLQVCAVSDDLVRLSNVPLRLGFPDVASSDGRRVLARVASGSIRVGGLLRHPVRLSRLNRLLSVR